MAELIPYGLALSLVNKIASRAFYVIGHVYGVADELEELKSTLESIRDVLSDAKPRQARDAKHWIWRFKQLLHDADDLMDDLAINDLKRKADGPSKSKVRVFCYPPVWFVERAKIEKIRKKFNNVTVDMVGLRQDVADVLSLNLNLNEGSAVLRQDETFWKKTGSFVLETGVIGRDDDKREIIELMRQTHEINQNVSIVAIVGIAGLGKTTLAHFVYNDVEVKSVFQKLIWVCVSENFEVETILKKMLKYLKKDEAGDLELASLQEKLRQELKGQRYMIVLDDVWNENEVKWDALRTPLMSGGKGSVILVTTRSRGVAQTMGISNPYVLKGLTEEQSWVLLEKVTFGENVSKMSPDLASIGVEIARKCRGVPLAIKTVGGLLQSRQASEWKRISDHRHVWSNCRERESILPMLNMSYHNLPFELRSCFSYCCLYPKDWQINRNELIQLWMAQGFLESSDESESVEEMGNNYVKILLMKSFFQEPNFDKYGDIVDFKMHDLMHDLATFAARTDCYVDSEENRNIGRAMHISFLSSNGIHSIDSIKGRKLRTIVGLNIEDELLATPSMKSNLKYLRALDLSRSSITKLPKFIGKSKHLRHLDLSYCSRLISLPGSMKNLVLLYTLKLNGCSQLVFGVEVITKLISLRYLYFDGCKAFDEKMPAGLGKLTSLRCLSDFVVGGNAKLNELRDLNLIRENLTITRLNLVEDVPLESREANLKGKKLIRSLTLTWGKEQCDFQGECKNIDSLQLLDNLWPHVSLRILEVNAYPGMRFSSWLSSLTNIVEIVLRGFSKCQDLPPLEILPSLEKLVVENMNELKFMQYKDISVVFFPSLKALNIVGCQNLRGWQRLGDDKDGNNMHKNLFVPRFLTLSELSILDCPNLTCMPTFPRLNEMLSLNKCSIKPVIKTCSVQREGSSFRPLSSLRCLDIGDVTEAETTTKEWVCNLTSLKVLILRDLTLLQHINSQLQQLTISSVVVDKFELWKNEGEDSTQYNAPPPALCSLHTLNIHDCYNMTVLPEQIGNLKSLRHIQLRDCPELESLPEAIRSLTNLQSLRIRGCPLLRDRCQAEVGEDWPKIDHILNRVID